MSGAGGAPLAARRLVRKAPLMLAALLLVQVAVSFTGRSFAPLGPFLEVEFSLSKAQVGPWASSKWASAAVRP